MSSAIGEAFVRIRPDTRGFAAETKKGVGSALKTGAAFAGIGFGIAEVVKQLRAATAVERDRQLIARQAQTALRAAGQDWADYKDQIDKAIQSQSKLTAFDDEDLLKSFTLLFRATKDVNSALRLNGIAADVARGRNMDLTRTAQLLVRVQAGQVGSLRRLGIQIDKHATGVQAIAAVERQYAGAGKTFADSQLGAQARLNKVWNDTQEIVGQKLAPAIADYQRRLSAWLSKANESGETQRVVNTYLGGAVDVLKGVVAGFRTAKTVVTPFVDALGGVERTAKLLVLAFAVSKAVKFAVAVRGAASSFGLVAAASRATTAKVVADAAVAEAALDTAYRPRTVPVTVVERMAPYTMVPGKTTPVPTKQPGRLGRLVKGVAGALGLTGAGAALGRARASGLIRFGLNPFTFTAAALGSLILIGGGDSRQGSQDIEAAVQKYPYVADLINRIQAGGKITPMEAASLKPLAGKSLATLSVADLRALNDRLKRSAEMGPKRPLPKRPDDRAVPRPTVSAATDAATGGAGSKRLTGKQVTARVGAFEESIQNAQIARNKRNEKLVLDRERKFLEAQLAPGGARLSVAERRQLKDTLLNVKSQIQSIEDDAAQAAQTAEEQRQRKAEHAFTKRIKTRVAGLERRRRQAANRKDLDGQKDALMAEERFLRDQIKATAAGSDRRQLLLDLLQAARDRFAALKAKTKTAAAGTIDTVMGRLERQRREAAARGDKAAQERLLAAEEKHLRGLIDRAKKGSLTRERLQNELVAVHEKQARLKKSTGAATGESVQDVFRQALDAWQQFGSNIGGQGALLSRQQVRGFVGGRIVAGMASGMTDEQIRTRLMEAGVTEARRQTEILARIHAELLGQKQVKDPVPKAKTTPRTTPSLVYATDGNEYLYGRPG